MHLRQKTALKIHGFFLDTLSIIWICYDQKEKGYMVWAPDFVYLVLFCKCAEMNIKKNGKTEEGTLLLLNNPFHLNEKKKINKNLNIKSTKIYFK